MTKIAIPRMQSVEKILYRIKTHLNNVQQTKEKLRGQKINLVRDVYMYITTLMIKGATQRSAIGELTSEIGRSSQIVRMWFRQGEFIKDTSADVKKIWPSALSASCQVRITNSKHLKKLASLLNKSAGPSEVKRAMARMGYIPDPATPPWARRFSRDKEMVKDWEPELKEMRKALETCAVGERVEITVKLGGHTVITV